MQRETNPSSLAAQLRAVAVEVAMPVGEGLAAAVVLAEDLVAAGSSGSATVAVASLPRNSIRSEAEPLVRAMLTEHGLEVPEANDEPARYRLLLWSFAHAGLPMAAFEPAFYARFTSWDVHDNLDRELMLMLHQRDEATTPVDLNAIEERMRSLLRSVIPPEG